MLDNIPLRPFKSDVKLISDEYPLKVLCVEDNSRVVVLVIILLAYFLCACGYSGK